MVCRRLGALIAAIRKPKNRFEAENTALRRQLIVLRRAILKAREEFNNFGPVGWAMMLAPD